MAGYGRGTAQMLCAVGQALKTQSNAVDHGTHFSPDDIPAGWDFSFGQYVPCPKCLKPVRGVIAYLRKQADGKNPSAAGVMKVTASSHFGEFHPNRVLDWVDYSYWKAVPWDNEQWLQLDFLDKLVIVKEYALYAWGQNKHKAKGWSLDGRNSEDEPWENISTEPFDHGRDGPLDGHDGPVVFPSFKPDKMYRYLRFCRLVYGPLEQTDFPAVEFFGALVILKDPPLDAIEPEMV